MPGLIGETAEVCCKLGQVFRPHELARPHLESVFLNLAGATWSIRSPWDDTYRCISWAACRTDSIWWPVDVPPPPGNYWPATVPIDDKVEYFVQAFATLGYSPCDSDVFELGFQKVAIYAGD